MYLMRKPSGIYYLRKVYICPVTMRRREIRRSTGCCRKGEAQIIAIQILGELHQLNGDYATNQPNTCTILIGIARTKSGLKVGVTVPSSYSSGNPKGSNTY